MKAFFRTRIIYDTYDPKLKIYDTWNSILKKKNINSRHLLDLKLDLSHLFLAVIKAKPLSINQYQSEIMLRAKKYIKEHFKQRINLDQLATEMGYSKFHFVRLFKKYFTLTIQEYIDVQRLKYVNSKLSEKVSKKEISNNLGFSSPTAFSNWYSKYRNID